MGEVRYRGGNNVAMKLPPHHFDGAVKFYRDTLGLKISDHGESKLVEFGPIRLWLDPCPQFSQTELWLEVVASNSDAADERPGRQEGRALRPDRDAAGGIPRLLDHQPGGHRAHRLGKQAVDSAVRLCGDKIGPLTGADFACKPGGDHEDTGRLANLRSALSGS